MTENETITTAPAPPSSNMGSLAWDFGLPVRGRLPVLSIAGRTSFPFTALAAEFVPAGRHEAADAALQFRPARRSDRNGPLPVLQALPAFLRAPPVRRRHQVLCGITLARAAPGGRLVGWAERILDREGWFTHAVASRAARVLRTLLEARLGGSWWGAAPRLSSAGRAVVFAAHNEPLTRRMISIAVAESGAANTILVSPRPGALAAICARLGVTVQSGVVDPWPLIEEAACLHAAADGQAAILAQLMSARVCTHGPGQPAAPDPLRLAAATLLLGARYADPFTGEPTSCEAFLQHASEWRKQASGPAEIACCVGISFWKRRRITEMLGAHRKPAFRRTAKAAVAASVRQGGSIAVWASRVPVGLDRHAQASGVAVSRIEDGFIRSVGLGADFLPPLSIVLDRLGLYYDASACSDLEAILSDSRFAPALTRRAAALRVRIVHKGVTKYNLSAGAPPGFIAGGRRLVLVPGQVANDRSVVLGGNGVRPGLELLAQVRRHRPEAFIVYKPHPDVDAGHRPGAIPDAAVLEYADQIVRGGSMAALLDGVHEIHTLTSLTGFEALLRGKPVTTYGQPFYAGWGLTTDLNPLARRVRRLSLDELTAGALILYPRYLDPITGLPCGPEIVLDRLADPRLHRAGLLVRARRLQGSVTHRLKPMLQQALQKGASL